MISNFEIDELVAAFRLHQRRERRGIVEHQIAHQLVGALTHAENNRRSRRASSSAMVSALIMPRSALNKMRKKYVFIGSAPPCVSESLV
jgi:hypothetical protein